MEESVAANGLDDLEDDATQNKIENEKTEDRHVVTECEDVEDDQMKCDICNTTYAWKKSLRRHMRQKHGGRGMQSSKDEKSNDNESMADAKRKVKSKFRNGIENKGYRSKNTVGIENKSKGKNPSKSINTLNNGSNVRFTWKGNLRKYFNKKLGDDNNSIHSEQDSEEISTTIGQNESDNSPSPLKSLEQDDKVSILLEKGDNPSKDKNGLNNGEDTMSEIQTEVDVAKPLLMGQNKNDKDEITLSARVPPEPKQYVSMLRKSNRNKQKSKNSITAKGEEPIPKKQKKTGTSNSITAKDEEPSPKKQKKTGNQTSVDTKTEPKSKSTNKYKCQHCDQAFTWKKSLDRHKKKKHNEFPVKIQTFQCRGCRSNFPSYMERFYHEKEEHNYIPELEENLKSNYNPLGNKNYKCPVCYRYLRTKDKGEVHIRDHYKIDIKDLTCDVCSVVFRTKDRLLAHKETHDEAKFSCEICGKLFRIKQYFIAHKLTHGIEEISKPEQIENEDTVKEPCPFPGLCDICGRSFRTKAQAIEHRTIHFGNEFKKYECPACGKLFRIKGSLTAHMYTHRDFKNFTCEVCGSSFKSSNNLRKHRQTHLKLKKYKCKYCDQKFRSDGGRKCHYLKEHRHNMTTDGLKYYTCSLCDHGFPSNMALTRHMTIHADDKPYVCSICSHRFVTDEMLKVHRRAHFDENKHFRCKICVKSFFNKDKLKTHLSRMNHKQNCISAGFSQDSIIKDVDNKDIVDMPVNRKAIDWYDADENTLNSNVVDSENSSNSNVVDSENTLNSNVVDSENTLNSNVIVSENILNSNVVDSECQTTDEVIQGIISIQNEVEVAGSDEEIITTATINGEEQNIITYNLEDLKDNQICVLVNKEHYYVIHSTSDAVDDIHV